jgi:DNA-binding NarL/FixJ family response regulator
MSTNRLSLENEEASMATSVEGRVLELLDQILNVLATQVQPEGSLTERARALKRAGLDNRRIAEVLGTTASTVSVLTTRLRDRPVGRLSPRRRKTGRK